MPDRAGLKVSCFLFDPNVGGPTIRARQISSLLKADDITVNFALPGTQGTARAFLEEAGFRVDDLDIPKPVLPNKPLKFLKFLAGVPGSILRIRRYLKTHKPDVVHINGAFDILPALAAKLSGVRVVWQLNDMLFGKRLSHILGRLVGGISDVVAVTSVPVIDHYNVARYDPVILPVPVDMTRYTAKEYPRAGPVTFGFLGNWNPLKGQDDFIETVHSLSRNGHDVSARIFGKLLDSQESYWKPLLARIQSDGLSDIIHVEGFTDDVPEALKTIDIMLITSVSEAGPLSCLEAMACGIPIIAYAVGDVHKMLDPNGAHPGGIVIDIKDVNALKAACETLLRDPERAARLGASARNRAREFYDLPSVAPKTASAYRKALR